MEIWRCECGKVFPIFFGENEEEIKERMVCRQKHEINILESVDDSFVSERPSVEPVRTSYFYAVDENGKRWVVKKWRTDINEPFAYMFFEDLVRRVNGANIQEDAIRQRLDVYETENDFLPFLISFLRGHLPFVNQDRKMFIKGINPLEVQVLLNRKIVEHLIYLANSLLKKDQLAFFEEFLKKENVPGGILPFRGQREIVDSWALS